MRRREGRRELRTYVVCAHGGGVRRGTTGTGADVAHGGTVHLQLRLDALPRVPLRRARRGCHRVDHITTDVPRVATARPKEPSST